MRIATSFVGRRFILLVVLGTFSPLAAAALPPEVDPKALAILRRMSDYLDSLKVFSLETENSTDDVRSSGQKLQYVNATSMVIQRPDHILGKRIGDVRQQEVYFDGSTLTLYNPGDKVYASVAAPPTLAGVFDTAQSKYDLSAPASDLVVENSYEGLTQDVVSGMVVGKAIILGVRCDVLAFRGSVVDFQIWIQEGKQPLPRRFVITSKLMAGAPQFQVEVTRWNLSPKMTPGMFTFKPPKGVQQIEFLPASTIPASSN